MLHTSDKYVTVDYPHVSEEKKQEWFVYRKALRDLPATIVEQNIVLDVDLTNVVFPTHHRNSKCIQINEMSCKMHFES